MKRKVLLIIAACVVLIGLITGTWFWWMISRTPQWWSPTDPTNPQAAVVGQSLENRVLTRVHKSRSREENTWTIVLREQEINNWFAVRFPAWAANRIPDTPLGAGHIRQVHTRIESDRIHLGLRAATDPTADPDEGQILTITVRPQLDDENQLRLTIESCTAGALSLPISTITGYLNGLIDNTDDLNRIINGQPLDPIIKLADGRKVHLINLQLEPQTITLTCQTEPNH